MCNKKICCVEGCNNEVVTKDMCGRHYQQVRKFGEVKSRTRHTLNDIILYEDYAEIVLYDNNCHEVARAIIDLEDVDKCKNIKWHIDKYGYVCANRQNNNMFLHRYIMGVVGDKEVDYNNVIDHLNHNPLDNRKSNLKVCSQRENNKNRRGKKSKTGVVGVTWSERANKYIAYIGVNGKRIHLGSFDTLEEAKEARERAEREYFID